MPLPAASPCYNVDCLPVIARGVSYTKEQLDILLEGPVKNILQDTVGHSELGTLLAGVATTEFEQVGVEELLKSGAEPEDWFVGEAIAETYVVEKGNCVFPWPGSRDLKNPESSPAGADLTGFQEIDSKELPYRFVFGEVKTSNECQWPPQAMYGRTGLKNQLEGLRDSRQVKDALVKYLGFHALNSTWCEMFKSAVKRYLSSGSEDIAIFGVMVRDVPPQKKDLEYRASALAENCPAATKIELYALYLPLNSIETLSGRAMAALHAGGGSV